MSSEKIEPVSVKQEKPVAEDPPAIKPEPEERTTVKEESEKVEDKSIPGSSDSESSPPKKVKVGEEDSDQNAEPEEVSVKNEEPVEPMEPVQDVKSEHNKAAGSVKIEIDEALAARFKPLWTHRPRREYPVLQAPPLEPQHVTSLATLGPFLAKHDNWRNYDYITPIPQICKDEPCMLGIDEAGRGPVLGPMVYGIAFCPLSQAAHLKTLGCADSKQLSEPDRERIFDDLNVCDYARTNIGWAIDVISPSYISEKMLSRVKVSLNEISMLSAIGLVEKAIAAGVNIAEVYVDTVGPADKYQARLQALWPDFQITVAKKADSTYPIVSAASICAKVSRDHSLRVWKFPEGITATHEDFGSGYPGDPKTKAFLEDNVDRVFGFPRIVRFSWSTAAEVLKRKAIPMVFPDTEDEKEQKARKARSIKNFMGPADPEAYEPCQFFKDRHLSHCYEI